MAGIGVSMNKNSFELPNAVVAAHGLPQHTQCSEPVMMEERNAVTKTLAEALVAEMLRMSVATTGTGAATKAASDSKAELSRPLIVVPGDTRSAADSMEAIDSMVALSLRGGREATGAGVNAWQNK